MWRAVLATTGTPGLVEELGGVAVVDVTRPAQLTGYLADGDDPVVVVTHPVHAHAARVACTVVSGDRPDLLVARRTATQAPLAALLALVTARRSARDAGHGATLWADLSDATWSAAVVSRASRLPHPNPSLVQHARSLLPGSRYVVRLHPDPEVLGTGQLAAALAPLAGAPVRLTTTGTDPEEPVLRTFVAQVRPRSLERLDLPGDWSAVFGGPVEQQLAVVPQDVLELTRPAGPPCKSCGLSLVEPVCGFCQSRTGAELTSTGGHR